MLADGSGVNDVHYADIAMDTARGALAIRFRQRPNPACAACSPHDSTDRRLRPGRWRSADIDPLSGRHCLPKRDTSSSLRHHNPPLPASLSTLACTASRQLRLPCVKSLSSPRAWMTEGPEEARRMGGDRGGVASYCLQHPTDAATLFETGRSN